MTVDAADEAARLGNVREAIERIFAESGVDPARKPTYFVDRIGGWSKNALGGALADDRHLRELVLEAYRSARVDVPSSVHRLCAAADDAVGFAVFPVAARDGRERRGALRALVVSADSRASKHPVVDATFELAVEKARTVVLSLCGGPAKERVRSAAWRVVPDLASNAELRDGSVALAALVAFVSHGLGKPVPAAYAFSGVFNGKKLGGPASATFDVKRHALRERPSLEALYWPGFGGDPEGVVVAERRLEGILARVFEQPWDELASSLRAPVSSSRRALAAGTFVVVAAGTGLAYAVIGAMKPLPHARDDAESGLAESMITQPSSTGSPSGEMTVRIPSDADVDATTHPLPTRVSVAPRASGSTPPTTAAQPVKPATAEASRGDDVKLAWSQLANGDGATCRRAFYRLKSLGAFTGELSTTDPTKIPASSAQVFVGQCFARAGDCVNGFKAYEEIVGMWTSIRGARGTFDVVAPECRDE